MENKDLIHLQHSHTTQHTNELGEKTEWSVQKNITNEELAILPSTWDENTVFTALDFAKVFELEAFNVGINFGVKKMTEKYEAEKDELIKIIRGLEVSNESLANKLGQLIGEE